MIKSHKKLNTEDIEKEEFEIKPYISNLKYSDAIRFKLRAKVLNPIKTHMKSDEKFTKELWSCKEHSLLETSSHLMKKCGQWEEEWRDLDLDDDEDIVKFFRLVLERKEEEDENDESWGNFDNTAWAY